MQVTIDYSKSIEENASLLFEKIKKIKSKKEGILETIDQYSKRLEKVDDEIKKHSELVSEKERLALKKREKKAWYHAFRWFYTSDGFLVIGGRDATSNEVVIKKHASPGDLVFHTDMAGSPFFVLKLEGKEPSQTALSEVADATATFSRAWQKGLPSQDVFYVTPEQVSKTALQGEHLKKGAFMIYGKTTYVKNKVNLAVGIDSSGFIFSGPVEAVKRHTKKHVVLIPGNAKASDVAKAISKKLDYPDLDDIIRALPAGGFAIL